MAIGRSRGQFFFPKIFSKNFHGDDRLNCNPALLQGLAYDIAARRQYFVTSIPGRVVLRSN